MTSPSLPSQPLQDPPVPKRSGAAQRWLPVVLFVLTMLSTTAVGMRYMYNFRIGHSPLTSDADVLPFGWAFANLRSLSSGLPFSLTLVGILLAHEFGHYAACRWFGVRSTLPYLLPAPSLSGTFGAVIRLRSRVRTRGALMVIGAAGPIAGFAVALATLPLGLTLSRYAGLPVIHRVQAPLLLDITHSWLQHLHAASASSLPLIVPHPILVASWIGLLITALNLIPAGQLDGGHIVYALSPRAHRLCSRIVTALLLLLGVFAWAGWLFWAAILMLPAMRHPQLPEPGRLNPWHIALVPVCVLILLLTATLQPFEGFSLLDVLHKLPHRYR